MGATSVTGVGNGAANLVRGPGNGRNSFVSTLDPHVVFSGTVPAGDNIVTLPSTVKDLPENLTIILAGKSYMTDKNLDGDGLVESFDILTAKKMDCDFIVVKNPGGIFSN